MKPGPKVRPASDRFWVKVDKNGPNGCWLWTASLSTNGYGQISVANRPVFAHRLSYEMLVGPIPKGLELDHLCRVRHCCNPAHLEPVTHVMNLRRSPLVTSTHCKKGHEFTPGTTYVRPSGGRLCRICQGHRPWSEYRPELIDRLKTNPPNLRSRVA
jgi:hypothetical protein